MWHGVNMGESTPTRTGIGHVRVRGAIGWVRLLARSVTDWLIRVMDP
jgi:hypothetical protein